VLSCGSQVYVRSRVLESPAGSVRLSGLSQRALACVLIALCAWAGLAGAARAAAPGTISTVAGNGGTSNSVDGLPAVHAELPDPGAVATTPTGDMVITSNDVVQLVAGASCASDCPYGLPSMTKGDIYTVAGNGSFGYSGDSGPATEASLWSPGGVAVDERGDLIIPDRGNYRVRLVARSNCASDCPFGLASMTSGFIYTIAGGGSSGGLSGNGGPATSAGLAYPTDVAVDSKGDLAITDGIYPVVRLVAGSDCASACAYGLPSTKKGDIYLVAGTGVDGFSEDGVPAATSEIGTADGVAFDGEGDLLIADYDNHVQLVAGTSCAYDCQYGLRSMTPGDIYTVAGGGSYARLGDGLPAYLASLEDPVAVAVDGVGDLLIDDSFHDVIRIVPDIGCSTQCAYGDPGHWEGKGFIYTLAGNGTFGFGGDSGPATSAELQQSLGFGVDGSGNLLIADTFNSRIRMVTAAQPPPVCYETGAREVGKDGFTGTRDQEDVIVYAPAGLKSITDVRVVNGTATHPAFTEGTKGPVIVTATKAVQNSALSGYYKATAEDGRSTYCGFYLTTQ
jgi:trimeric autotransporter adhesin